MRHDKLIERLGGYRTVAEALGCDPSTAYRWQDTGIPADRWPAILRLASKAGIELTADALLRNSPQYSAG